MRSTASSTMWCLRWRASGSRGRPALRTRRRSGGSRSSGCPDFVTEEELCWAKQAAWEKKKLDCGAVEFLTVEEGLCVQCMHLGPFDTEAETVARMDSFLAEKGYVNDLSETRMHHEIYLSDTRRVIPEKWKTVIRHPIRRG